MLTLATRLEVMGRLGRALADPTRCQILLRLLERPTYPGTLAGELGLTRSNVSNHLACLRGCGLVVATPQGRQMQYALSDPNLAHALSDLVDVVLAVDHDHQHRGAPVEVAVPDTATEADRVTP